jgi:hypothetical protein
MEAVAYTLHFYLQPLLRSQVVKGSHDSFTRCASRLDSTLKVEMQPRSGFLGTAKQGSEKLPPLAGKLRQYVCRRLQWPKLIAGIECGA